MPGTFSRLRPKVTSPISTAASTTPTTVPEPPATLTPPRIAMVMISSSMPCAMLGRVEPSRDVSSTEATPEARPVAANSQNR